MVLEYDYTKTDVGLQLNNTTSGFSKEFAERIFVLLTKYNLPAHKDGSLLRYLLIFLTRVDKDVASAATSVPIVFFSDKDLSWSVKRS